MGRVQKRMRRKDVKAANTDNIFTAFAIKVKSEMGGADGRE